MGLGADQRAGGGPQGLGEGTGRDIGAGDRAGAWGWAVGLGAVVIRAGAGSWGRGWGGAAGAGNGPPLLAALSLFLLGLWEGASWALLTSVPDMGWGQVWIGKELVMKGCLPRSPHPRALCPTPLCPSPPQVRGSGGQRRGPAALHGAGAPQTGAPAPALLPDQMGWQELPAPADAALRLRGDLLPLHQVPQGRWVRAGGRGSSHSLPSPPAVTRAPSWGWAR